MILLVTGSREWQDKDLLLDIVDEFLEEHEVSKIIVSDTPGAEKFVRDYCEEQEMKCKVYDLKTYISEHGAKLARDKRNYDMVEASDALIAFPMAGDRNTQKVIAMARKKKWKDILVI